MNCRGCFTIVASAAAIFLSGTLHAQVLQLTSHQGNADAGKVKFDGSGKSKFVLVDGDTVVTPPPGGAAVLKQKTESQGEAPPRLDAMSVIQKLRNVSTWSPLAAERYWDVNRKRLELTHEMAQELVDKEIGIMCGLKPRGKVLALLESNPESSGLLAMAIDRESLAGSIIDAPRNDRDMLVASCYHCTDPVKTDAWGVAIRQHASLIAFFQRKCPAIPYQGLFDYLDGPHPSEAKAIYGEWLNALLSPAVISASDQTMSSRLVFAYEASAELRRWLDKPDFRSVFPTQIWPRFRDSIADLSRSHADGKDLYYLCAGEPSVWEFFQRADSRELFTKVGMEAVVLLCGENKLNQDVYDVAARMWHKGIIDLPRSIARYQDDVDFRELVKRLKEPDDWCWLNAICEKLDQKGDQWPQEASFFAKLTTTALRKDLVPEEPSPIPGAGIVSLVGRAISGRRVPADIWLAAGFDLVDGVELALMAASGGASKLVTGPAKAGARSLAMKGLTHTLKTAAKESVGKIVGKTAKELAAQGATSTILIGMAIGAMPDLLADAVKLGVVDITDLTKSAFNMTRGFGIERETFAKIGLEPRLFMRGDGRVYVNLVEMAVGLAKTPSPASKFLEITALNAAMLSEPAQDAGTESARSVEQWRSDISGWWSGNATNQFEPPVAR